MKRRLATARTTVPALAGIVAALLVTPALPLLKPFFGVPDHGIGLVTVTRYPKHWDYAAVAMLTIVAALVTFATALLLSPAPPTTSHPSVMTRRHAPLIVMLLMIAVAVIVLPARDHPYEFADPYHEGENLSPLSIMKDGGRPYRDVWFMHGVGADGGLDLLVLGDPPSIVRTRRLRAFLGAATVAFLVPIAAELSSTWLGVILAVIASLCGLAAGQLPATPHFRLLPLLLAVWLALLWIRTNRTSYIVAACATASAGMLWSLDVGLFAMAGLWLGLAVWRRIPAIVASLITAPLILLLIRGDISRFFRDSFLRLPECFDAIYSLPAPPLPQLSISWITSESARYYLPPILYGALLAASAILMLRDRARGSAMFFVLMTALVSLRTAWGRVSWGHTRFAVPLLGIIIVAFVIEPLLRTRRVNQIVIAILIVIVAFPYFEIAANAKALAGYWSNYRQELRPKGDSVPFPLPRAHDLYTYPREANELRALYEFSQSMPPGPIFDYSGEKYVYYMLARPASTRCHDIPYLSDPALGREAMKQLERRRPVFVVVSGHPGLSNIDGVSNAQRTPEIAAWIDRNYAKRITAGRYTIGLPSTYEFQQNVPRGNAGSRPPH